jgi:hypothetical protein
MILTMYPCSDCDRSFGSKSALKQHRENSPTHTNPTQCKVCDRTFGSQQALEQHRRDAPAHPEVFECKACNRSFGSASAVRQHERDSPIHTTASPTSFNADLDSTSTRTSESRNRETEYHARGVDRARRDSALSTVTPPRQKSRKQDTETREFFTFPELHPSVAEAVALRTSTPWSYESQPNTRHHREHSTKVMGKFLCNNAGCRNQSWGSKIVAIWIKEHTRSSYSAVVYNQRCRSCNCLGDLRLDQDCYVERVAYRLKKWAGVEMEQPPFERKKGPPHESALCEGCKRGVCPQVKGSGLD